MVHEIEEGEGGKGCSQQVAQGKYILYWRAETF